MLPDHDSRVNLDMNCGQAVRFDKTTPLLTSTDYPVKVPETLERPERLSWSLDAARWRQLVAASLLFALYASLSIRQHHLGLTGGYDLGIFEQAVRHLANFEVPRTLVNGEIFPRFIVVLIAPFYALFPTPVTLLVVQAFLMAVGVIPLMSWAERSLGKDASAVVAIVYGIAPGIATAVGFDFHEIAFAVPLLAFSMSALGQQHWHRAVYWAIPLVFVKEDLGLTVAAIGIYVFFRGERKLGATAAVVGVFSTAVTMLFIFPALSKSGEYLFTQTMMPQSLFGSLETVFSGLDLKLLTIIALLGPTAFFALKSPLVLMALPTLGWRFMSDNPLFWVPEFHYDAVLVPIVTAAFIDGISKKTGRRERTIFLATPLICTIVLASAFDFSRLASKNFWSENPHAEAIHRLTALVPDDARVAATNNIVPQLTSRTTTYEFGTDGDFGPGWQPNNWKSADWILVDTRAAAQFKQGNAAAFREQLVHGFTLVAEEDGIRLARRQRDTPPR